MYICSARVLGFLPLLAVLCMLPTGCGRAEGDSKLASISYPVVNAPEFVGGTDDWLNSKPLSIKDLRGKVVLVDFWEYTCVNCIRTFPYLTEWYRRYADKGLVIVGIHTPEFEFAKSKERVSAAAQRFGLAFPILLDNEYENWSAYANRYWPRKYLIDKNGKIVYDHIGEGGYGTTEKRIQALLRDAGYSGELPPIMESVRETDRPGAVCYPTTPELYAGSRGYQSGHFGQDAFYRQGQVVVFSKEQPRDAGRIYLSGKWYCGPESVRAEGMPAAIELSYKATEVNAVLKSGGAQPIRLLVTQDGKPLNKASAGQDARFDEQSNCYVEVAEGRMYSLVVNPKHGEHVLTLTPQAAGVELYSFTFSSSCVEP
ncbi:MAG: redoxin family protein [Fimbriimonadia bacterium]|jgi:thiol-disulfide isomerase/thioredoxin